MALDARVEAQKLREMYMNDPRQQSFNLLLLGEKSSGKTNLLKTARMPVHVDSFDPEGCLTLRDEIIKGDVVADTRWEHENPLEPKQFKAWLSMFEYRLMSKYFDFIGTYCIDSTTTWSMAIMGQIMADDPKSKPGEIPKWGSGHYTKQRRMLENIVQRILSLPCDVILTGHLAPIYEDKRIPLGNNEYDTQRELVRYDYMAVGQSAVIIPTLFSEMWVMQTEDGPLGPKYSLLTSRKGLYKAGTRLGAGGKLSQKEEPNIKAILKKCGLKWEDKEPLYDAPSVHKPLNPGQAILKARGK